MADFEIQVLGSGSRGNATIMRYDETTVLVDSGFTMKEITRRMQLTGWDPEQIDAIVLTHYHSDHIHSAHMLSNKYGIPIYCTEETYPVIIRKSKRKLAVSPFNEAFSIKQLMFNPIPLDHDARGTVGFHISQDGTSLVVATDLGVMNNQLSEPLKKSKLWLLESNHDSYLLKEGPYPLDLKFRISSNFGHLSNDQAMDIVETHLTSITETIIFGHLSQENNSPSLVKEALYRRISESKMDQNVFIATQEVPLPKIII